MPDRPLEGALEIAEAWARMLKRLRDPQLQVGWLREQIVRAGAARAADVLTIVLARAEQREQPYSTVLLRVSLALSQATEAELKRAIARCAAAREQATLARFLGQLEPTPSGEGEAGEGTGELEEPESPKWLQQGRPLSLGERKSLARGRDRQLLARVLRDPHPDVVAILLDNPALTELDVVRLCARRPNRPDVLHQVFRHTRWILRYRVRLALALNPYTPPGLTLQLLPHLTAHDLRAVARSGELSAEVRAACVASREGPLH